MSIVAEEAAKDVASAAPWIYKLAREYGIFAVIALFFIWQGSVREREQAQRADANDAFIKDKFVTTVDNNTKAIEGFKAVLMAKFPEAR